VLIVSYQNRVFSTQQCAFACWGVCNIDWFGTCVSPSIYNIFASQGSQWYSYAWEDPRDALITTYASPKTVDCRLTLIFRKPQGASRCCFCLERLPTSHKWMSTTNRNITYRRCKAKNRWRSVDVHFEDIVAMSSLLLLPRKAADNLIMACCRRTALGFSMIQGPKSLRLIFRT
jgi:hypothetical protein